MITPTLKLSCMQAERVATKLRIFAQDVDVLMLSVRCYPILSQDSVFVCAAGVKDNCISLRDVFQSLRLLKADILPGFYALSGCDINGRLVGKTKLCRHLIQPPKILLTESA